jgi:hypothetical protein
MMILSIVMIHDAMFGWIIIVPIASTVSIAYTSILTLFSDQVSADKQGWVMGVSGSILAFVFGIDGIVVGIIATWHDTLPLLIAATCLLFTGVIAFFSLIRFNNHPGANINKVIT